MRALEVCPCVIWFFEQSISLSAQTFYTFWTSSSPVYPHSYESRARESGAAAACCSLSAGRQQTCRLVKITEASDETDFALCWIRLRGQRLWSNLLRGRDLAAVSQVSSLNYDEAFLCRSTWWSICCHLDSDWLQRPFTPTPVVTVNCSVGGVGVTVRAENTGSLITQNVNEHAVA